MFLAGPSFYIAAALILFVGIFSAFQHSKYVPIQGDYLGPQTGESRDEYIARAGAELAQLPDDDHRRWALVSFESYQDEWISAVVTENIPRVAGAIMLRFLSADSQDPVMTQCAVTEPVSPQAAQRVLVGAQSSLGNRGSLAVKAPENRVEALRKVLHEASPFACGDSRSSFDGFAALIVHAEPAQLKELMEKEEVVAVQPLPVDAVAGAFAVRPLTPQ